MIVGKEKIININSVLSGKTKSCSCYSKDIINTIEIVTKKMKNRYLKIVEGRNNSNPQLSSAKSVYRWYCKPGDKLTYDEFYKLSQDNCHYCGIKPFNIKNKYSDHKFEVIRKMGEFVFNRNR